MDVERYLREESKRLNKPYGLIVNDALLQYFDLDSLKNREAVLLKRLDQIDRKIEELHTNLSTLSEAFSIYIKTYFARLAEIPKEQSSAAMARANQLFNLFLQQVYEASLAGNSLFNDLPKEEWLSQVDAKKFVEGL